MNKFNSLFFSDFTALLVSHSEYKNFHCTNKLTEKISLVSLHQGKTTDKKTKQEKNSTYLLNSLLERQVTLYNQPSHAQRCTGYYCQGQL